MLSQRSPTAAVYRLLWLPSFAHSVCVRIERTAAGTRLVAKVLDGMGGYDPGQIAIEKRIWLTSDQVIQLDRHLDQAAYWKMETELKDEGGKGDDQLIVEGVKDGAYHIVDRWWADPAYSKLCRYMLGLSGLQIGKQWELYHPAAAKPEM
jgi:hypothetical protein